MKFKALRNLTLAAFGHVIVFKKGDELYVPPALRAEAVEQGLEQLDGETIERAAQAPDDTRLAAVKAAMEQIALTNDAGDFTADGIPSVKAITAITGGAKPANDKERASLWAEVIATAGQ